MDLSVALIIAASFAILCTFYIGKRILTIDFSEYSSKNSKKAKLERLLVKKGTPLQNSKIRRDIRKAFERILIPLGNADQDLLPARMDMAFRNKIVSQINRLNRNKLCRRIYITDVVPVPKNDFETWNDDGREWRESVLKCSTLERFESTEDNKVQHEIYRKNSYLRILQSRHVRSADRKEEKKSYYFDMLSITCPSCGAGVKLDSQQVTCEYCGAVIKNEFYDWQTEAFEIYEAISTNLKRFVQLLVSGSILFLCVFLCLYLIEDTEISIAAGVGAAVLTFGGIITPIICGKIKQEKLAGKIVRYSENYLRACLNEHFWENENDEDLLDFSVGTIKLLKVAHTEETTTVTADIFGTETFLPENQKPYTEKFKKRLIMQRARYPEKRKADGEFFAEKDCPSCGANFMPDENHCCSFCGYGLQVNNAKWIVKKINKWRIKAWDYLTKNTATSAGRKIGLLGNRKLEDGNLCKDCARKLSPFFSERRNSTVEDIKRQLAYRAENEKKLAGFAPSITFDGSKKVYIDPIGERFIVTGASNWRSSNPDLIAFSQVLGVDTDIRENKEEIFYEDSEGNEKSYVPPRYACDYEFNVTIRVDSPWFDEIELELSDGNRPDSPYTDLYRQYEQRMHELADILMRRDNRNRVWDGGMVNRVDNEDSRPERPSPTPNAMGGETWVCPSCGAQNNGKFCANCGAVKPVACSCCSNCGWRPANGQSLPKFCPECGRPLQ